jgi:hypothetical protein
MVKVRKGIARAFVTSLPRITPRGTVRVDLVTDDGARLQRVQMDRILPGWT